MSEFDLSAFLTDIGNHILDGGDLTIPENIPSGLILPIMSAIQEIDLGKGLPEQEQLDGSLPLNDRLDQLIRYSKITNERSSRLNRLLDLQNKLRKRIE